MAVSRSYSRALVLCLSSMLGSALAQDANVLTNAQVSKANFAIVPSLRDLSARTPLDQPFGFHQASPARDPKPHVARALQKAGAFSDSIAQTSYAPDTVPVKLLDWLGIGTGFFGFTVYLAPTDAQVAIGDSPCQVVQWVNVNFAVSDCAGNNLLFQGQHYGFGNDLFGKLPNCSLTNSGDIIAQFDKMAHRWVMYQPRFNPPYYDCFAISQTGDFLGAWYTYEFPTYDNQNSFPDYPKVGVWPDGYYVSHVSYYHAQTFNGSMPCAYDRVKMLAGDPSAQGVCFFDTSNGTLFDDCLQPSDLDSPNNLPPGGMPNVFMGSIDNFVQGSNIYYYRFHFVPSNPGASTFDCINGACKIPVATYQQGPDTVPEPGGNVVDGLHRCLMYRLAYRVLPGQPTQNTLTISSTIQNWLTSHTVNSNGHSAVRWYEFRAPSGSANPTLYQQGTYDPDSNYRWVPSLAMDKQGNIAMSYVVSNGTDMYPSMAFTGRSPGDPRGTMGAETILALGTGSQTDTVNRWGDYYTMGISNDGCTFVTTGQYYQTTSAFNWSTRVGKLKFDNCR